MWLLYPLSVTSAQKRFYNNCQTPNSNQKPGIFLYKPYITV